MGYNASDGSEGSESKEGEKGKDGKEGKDYESLALNGVMQPDWIGLNTPKTYQVKMINPMNVFCF